MSSTHTHPLKSRLAEIINRFHTGKVLVVGDIAIDEMTYGHTARLSREAPVLILHHAKTDILLGAGGNAAHNVATLSKTAAPSDAPTTYAVGVMGDDYYQAQLLGALTTAGVDTRGMVCDMDRVTTTKTRISGTANQSVTQQIVRIDRETERPVSGEIEAQLISHIEQLAETVDAILISDYGLGVVTPGIIQACKRVTETARNQGRRLILSVDSHQDLRLFQGADILTPNLPEAEQNMGHRLDTLDKLIAGGNKLLSETAAKALLITRGGEGMSLFTPAAALASEATHIPIPVFNKSEVFDVTGAGDTVIATLTLALAVGAQGVEAAILGNLAASIVVRRYGTATTTPEELLAALEALPDAMLSALAIPQTAERLI